MCKMHCGLCGKGEGDVCRFLLRPLYSKLTNIDYDDSGYEAHYYKLSSRVIGGVWRIVNLVTLRVELNTPAGRTVLHYNSGYRAQFLLPRTLQLSFA